MKGFTSDNLARFSDSYKSELRKVNHQAHRIFNVYSTGTEKVQHRHSKNVRMRGKKEVASLTLAERENPITVVICMNATGKYVPPLIVFLRKKYERRAYEWSTGRLNFGLRSKRLDSE